MKFQDLISELTDADLTLRSETVRAINLALVVRNWLFGWYIVEFEQNGEDRAKYGDGLIKQIAEQLKKKGVSGCAATNLRSFRVFYDRFIEKRNLSEKLIHQTVSGKFRKLLLITDNSTKSISKSPSQKKPDAVWRIWKYTTRFTKSRFSRFY